MSSTTEEIKLLPALPSDLMTIVTLEKNVFWEEEFAALAFGPDRGSEAALAERVRGLSKPPKPGHKSTIFKAVTTTRDDGGKEKEEIVGAAVWRIVRVNEEVETKEEQKEIIEWGGNWKFYEEVLLKGDELMHMSCDGKDYAKLEVLIINPSYQRRGIGTRLLSAFLEEADAVGLQAVLGASRFGRGLYKRFGFEDYKIMSLKLWEYEGGEKMGTDEHVIMNRPARKLEG